MEEILKKIDVKKLLQYGLYMLLLLVFQNMLFSNLRPFDVCAFFLPAAVVAVAFYESSMFSCMFAIVLGFFADMAYIENTITFTLTFPCIAFAAGFVSKFYINRQFFAYMVTATLALAAVAVIQMLKTAVSDAWSAVMIETALLQVLWSIPMAALVYFWPASRGAK